MAELGIFDDEKEKWIQFDEDTEILIAFLPKEDLKSIIRKAEKTSRLSGESSIDIANLNIAKKVVKVWRKIRDHSHPGLMLKGQPLPFNEENIIMLMKRSYEFSNFIQEYSTNVRFFMEEDDKVEIKNS